MLGATGTALKRTIPALEASALCGITVAHGRDPARLAAVAEIRPTIRLVTTENEFARMADAYDVVYVGSPPFLHVRHLRLAAELGKPAICEKPLISRREDLAPLRDVLAAAPPRLAIAHHVRHQPAVRDIVELLRSGRLGEPVAADLQWCFVMNHDARNAQWKLDPARGGSNAMFDCGVHAIDLALLLFGRPDRVSATGCRVRTEHVDDTVRATLEYPGLTVGVVASQSAAPFANDLVITFAGHVLRARNLLGEQSADAVEIADGGRSSVTRYDPVNLYRAEVEDFCLSLDGSAGPNTGVADALAATEILFAIEDALGSGTAVPLRGLGHGPSTRSR